MDETRTDSNEGSLRDAGPAEVLAIIESSARPMNAVAIEQRLHRAGDCKASVRSIEHILRADPQLFRQGADGRWIAAVTAHATSQAERLDALMRELTSSDEDDEGSITRLAAFESAGFEPLRDGLYDWQREALGAWYAADEHGVIEAITGAGKTRIGIAAIERHLRTANSRAAIVVPTIELQLQWQSALIDWFGWDEDAIGLCGGGWDDELSDHRVTIYVAKSAARHLPAHVRAHLPFGPTLLVADEVHRLGAEGLSDLLEARFRTALGLSATPERRYDDGMERLVFPAIGEVVFSYSYQDGLDDAVIAPFEIAFVGVDFAPAEASEYEDLTIRIGRMSQQLRTAFPELRTERNFFSRLSALAAAGEELPLTYLSAVQARRALMLNAVEREAFVRWLVGRLDRDARAILFHETIAGAEDSAAALREAGWAADAHHSALNPQARRDVLRRFESGELQAVAAPRTLDEGIDVPEADVAIIVTGSTSRRQRIQRAGRVLRKAPGKSMAKVVVLYVRGSREDPRAQAGGDPFVRTIEDLDRAWHFQWPRDEALAARWLAGKLVREHRDEGPTVLIASLDQSTSDVLMRSLEALEIEATTTSDANEVLATASAAQVAIVDRQFVSTAEFPSETGGSDAHRLLHEVGRASRRTHLVLLENRSGGGARLLGAHASIRRLAPQLAADEQRLLESLLAELVAGGVHVAGNVSLEIPEHEEAESVDPIKVVILSEPAARAYTLANEARTESPIQAEPFGYDDGLERLAREGTDVVVIDAGPLSIAVRHLIVQTRARTTAPIVVMSDEYDSKIIRRLEHSGVAVHLSKPVSTSALVKAIEGLCP